MKDFYKTNNKIDIKAYNYKPGKKGIIQNREVFKFIQKFLKDRLTIIRMVVD